MVSIQAPNLNAVRRFVSKTCCRLVSISPALAFQAITYNLYMSLHEKHGGERHMCRPTKWKASQP